MPTLSPASRWLSSLFQDLLSVSHEGFLEGDLLPFAAEGLPRLWFFFAGKKKLWPIFFLAPPSWRKTKKVPKFFKPYILFSIFLACSFEFHKYLFHRQTLPPGPEFQSHENGPQFQWHSEHHGRFNGMLCEVKRQVCSHELQVSNRSLERDPSIIDIEIQWIPLQT